VNPWTQAAGQVPPPNRDVDQAAVRESWKQLQVDIEDCNAVGIRDSTIRDSTTFHTVICSQTRSIDGTQYVPCNQADTFHVTNLTPPTLHCQYVPCNQSDDKPYAAVEAVEVELEARRRRREEEEEAARAAAAAAAAEAKAERRRLGREARAAEEAAAEERRRARATEAQAGQARSAQLCGEASQAQQAAAGQARSTQLDDDVIDLCDDSPPAPAARPAPKTTPAASKINNNDVAGKENVRAPTRADDAAAAAKRRAAQSALNAAATSAAHGGRSGGNGHGHGGALQVESS
jgi:hypothetical protein